MRFLVISVYKLLVYCSWTCMELCIDYSEYFNYNYYYVMLSIHFFFLNSIFIQHKTVCPLPNTIYIYEKSNKNINTIYHKYSIKNAR